MARGYYVIRHKPGIDSYLTVHFSQFSPRKAIGATVERASLWATIFNSETEASKALEELRAVHPVYQNFEVRPHPAVEK